VAVSCLNLDVSIEILGGGGKYCLNGIRRQDFDNFYPLPTRWPCVIHRQLNHIGWIIREVGSDRKVHQWNLNEYHRRWFGASLTG